jgi:hypothetical protein
MARTGAGPAAGLVAAAARPARCVKADRAREQRFPYLEPDYRDLVPRWEPGVGTLLIEPGGPRGKGQHRPFDGKPGNEPLDGAVFCRSHA